MRFRGVKDVSWSVPDGFEVADEPSKLDDTLVGSSVYMRWEKYGWQLGRITDIATDATPRVKCSKSSTTALLRPTAARGQLAITHGQSYLAQSLRCERAVCRPVR